MDRRAAGVHCSVRNGFAAALETAAALGCDTLQFFTQSPRGWRTRVYTEAEFAQFRATRAKLNLNPVVVHAPYLPNLCTSDDALYARSLEALRGDVDRSEKLGAEFLVIHPGAYSPNSNLKEGLDRIGAAINDALAAIPGRTRILIENMAGGGRRVGGPAQEIAEILARVKDTSRIGVCFDTCHALGAGYDISTDAGVEETLREFRSEIGLEKIFVFHANDSKAPLGSHRDMHQHLGEGYVGLKGLTNLLSRDEFARCAFILETPKLPVPLSDQRNLRSLRSCLAAERRPLS